MRSSSAPSICRARVDQERERQVHVAGSVAGLVERVAVRREHLTEGILSGGKGNVRQLAVFIRARAIDDLIPLFRTSMSAPGTGAAPVMSVLVIVTGVQISSLCTVRPRG